MYVYYGIFIISSFFLSKLKKDIIAIEKLYIQNLHTRNTYGWIILYFCNIIIERLAFESTFRVGIIYLLSSS